MADVTGKIGDQDVALDNAATEATLKAILAALKGQQSALAKLSTTAGGAGVNPQAIAAANKGIQQASGAFNAGAVAGRALNTVFGTLSKGAMILGGVLGDIVAGGIQTGKNLMDLAGKMLDGGGKVSDVFAAFKDLPFGLGAVASLFEKLMLMQQAELDTYRQMTKSGVNFAGELTDIRLTALELGTTLEGFGNLVQKNSTLFAQLGSTAEGGAKSFVNLAKDIRGSDVGKNLMALGYSVDDINQSTANYLKMTGGRTSEEMKNTKALTDSAGAYMKQLDMLATITGKSREEQEKALQEATANAAYEAYLQTLDEEGRKKATAAVQKASAEGGKGAADALKSQLLGLPPMTEAAQNFTALLPNAAKGVSDMGNAVKDSSKSLKDVNNSYSQAMIGSAQDAKNLGKEQMAAMSMSGGAMAETAMQAQKNANMLHSKNIQNADQFNALQEQIAQEQNNRNNSSAAAAAGAEDAFKKLAAEFYATLLPVIKELTPVITDLAKKMMDFAKENMPAIKRGLEMVVQFVKDLFSPEGREKIAKQLGEALSALVQKAWDSFKIFGNDSERPKGKTNAKDVGSDSSYGGQAGSIPGAADGGIVRARPGGQLVRAAEVGMNEAFVPLPDGNKIPVKLDLKMPNFDKIMSDMETFKSGVTSKLDTTKLTTGLPDMNKMFEAFKNPSGIMSELQSFRTDLQQKIKEKTGLPTDNDMSNMFSSFKESLFGKETPKPENPGNNSAKDLVTELQQLNKQTALMLTSLKELSDFSRRNLDATRGLGGNLLI